MPAVRVSKRPPQLLRSVAAEVAPILKVSVDSSLEQSCVPDSDRNAIVSSIFKKGYRYKAENYCPGSLTSVIYKAHRAYSFQPDGPTILRCVAYSMI